MMNLEHVSLGISKALRQLNKDLLELYTPVVQDMCDKKSVTQYELEYFLDYLVSACVSDEMLLLFKKVCRRFYEEYPETIAEYIMFYKEMYEDIS